VLAAHGAALIVLRGGLAAAGGHSARRRTVVAGALLIWMAVDRFDAPDGAGTLDIGRLARGLVHPIGVNPVLVIMRGRPLCAVRAAWCPLGRWRGVLVAALIAAPVVALLLAAPAAVFTDARALRAGPRSRGGWRRHAPGARPRVGGSALLLVSSAVATADRLASRPTRIGVRSWQP
jgi:hypothetical protein